MISLGMSFFPMYAVLEREKYHAHVKNECFFLSIFFLTFKMLPINQSIIYIYETFNFLVQSAV